MGSSDGPRPEYLEWLDATVHTETWVAIADLEEDTKADMICRSFCYVVRETDDIVWIAHTVTGRDCSTPKLILKAAIVERHPVYVRRPGDPHDTT